MPQFGADIFGIWRGAFFGGVEGETHLPARIEEEITGGIVAQIFDLERSGHLEFPPVQIKGLGWRDGIGAVGERRAYREQRGEGEESGTHEGQIVVRFFFLIFFFFFFSSAKAEKKNKNKIKKMNPGR
jgi:hypothetical protein